MKIKTTLLLGLTLAALLWQGCDRRVFPLTMPDNTDLVLRTEQNKRADWLEAFYHQYLALTCYSNWDDSTATTDSAFNALMTASCTDQLYNALYAPVDPGSIDWLDYDIFIQAQDCWPGIAVKEVTPVGDSYWMEAVIHYESDPDNQAMQHIYFYVDYDGGQLKIWSINDRCYPVGHAPQKLKIADQMK